MSNTVTRTVWTAAAEAFVAGLTVELVRTVEQRADVLSPRARQDNGYGSVGNKVVWGLRFEHNGVDLTSFFEAEYDLELVANTEYFNSASKKATLAYAPKALEYVRSFLLGTDRRSAVDGGYDYDEALRNDGSLAQYILG